MCSPYLELTLTEVKAKWKDTKKKCINNMTKSLNCQADLIKGKHLPNVFTVMASVYSGTTGSDKLRTPHLYRKACHTCSFVFSFTQVLPFCRPKSGTSFPLDRLQRNEAKSNSDVSTACVWPVLASYRLWGEPPFSELSKGKLSLVHMCGYNTPWEGMYCTYYTASAY